MTAESNSTGCFVAPGNHDGVHVGHRALVTAALEGAQRHGLEAIAMFFDPHPMEVLRGAKVERITTPQRRAQLLAEAGAHRVHVQPFTDAFSRLSPEAFVQEVLLGELGAKGVVVGPDFRFGQKAAGNVDTLRDLGDRYGFEVVQVDPVKLGDTRVSSTAVRESLRTGDLESATRMLTRAHDVEGCVVQGDQRGRTIGFPTANLDCAPVLLPADGVYAVAVREVQGTNSTGPTRYGVANLGVRPTFAAGRSVEVHLLDFEGDLYGKTLRVAFLARIRAEQKFDGLDHLKTQIASDAETARRLCNGTPKELLRCL